MNNLSAEEYKEKYDSLVEKEIMGMIGSRRFGPTYKKRFLDFYKKNINMRTYLKSFIFCKVKDYKDKIEKESDEEIKSKLEKDYDIYRSLFEDLLEIRTNI